ncbi:WD-40 repeat protein [Reticulomyxa filosa]|uniref:WD-40 repeat protein n=1 Tax=Reticulomyxa filosa TaxID=46433 RepID=X6PBG8_RETFI|nr:WD-40 repeat protein [Reticulomyxa filosa]|eukprot:ETO35017.1 WD-40 repeat protein [Reticulomyxa filosa]
MEQRVKEEKYEDVFIMLIRNRINQQKKSVSPQCQKFAQIIITKCVNGIQSKRQNKITLFVRVIFLSFNSTKKLFNKYLKNINRVKFSLYYCHNNSRNIICSSSSDNTIRLWDILSGQQIQVFNGHKYSVYTVEYSPFVVNNIEFVSSNVICSGSSDNTIRFWDIRSNRNELHIINGDNKDYGISCLKFIQLKSNNDNRRGINLCYEIIISLVQRMKDLILIKTIYLYCDFFLTKNECYAKLLHS